MTKNEIEQWIKKATFVTSSYFEYDGRGNREETRIYDKDGQLYLINFFNKKPSPEWGEKGCAVERDAYGEALKDEGGETKYIYAAPKPVTRIVKMVEVVKYIPIEEL